MKIFKDRTMPWWETGLIKWSALVSGIAAGAYWPNIFAPYVVALVVVALALGVIAFFFWSKE